MKNEKKKTEGEFTGINEIADETVVGGSGINAVRHLQFNGVVDEAEDNMRMMILMTTTTMMMNTMTKTSVKKWGVGLFH